MQAINKMTLADIAKQADVSVSTVSRVLNNQGRISAGTREKILGLLHGNHGRIGQTFKPVLLLLPHASVELDWYSFPFLNYLRQVAEKRNFVLDMMSVNDIAQLKERYYCGIIAMDYSCSLADSLGKKCTIPLVCLNDTGNPIENVYSIHSDEFQGIDTALYFLIGNNHRRIGFLSPSFSNQSLCGRLREKAFIDIMERFKCQDGIVIQKSYGDVLGAIDLLRKEGVTALICMTESAGPMILHACRKLNCRIPEDLSLITGEIKYISEYQVPPLTTLEQDFAGIANCAFDTLERISEGKNVSLVQKIPYLFHKRDSVSLPAARLFPK